MIVYLASPRTQQQADHVGGMPVLLSFSCAGSCDWLHRGYQQSFSRILIDSGAYSEFTTGKKVDLGKYKEWAMPWLCHADAVAGLDDIGGDWRRSMDNYDAFPHGFPTYHNSDPPALLPDLIAMARERGGWLGIGLTPPRAEKKEWLRRTLDRIPEGIHVHGWACRAFTHMRRLDSVDSTNWFRDAMKLKTIPDLKHLHYGECLEIVVKRYQRWKRDVREDQGQPELFRDE